MNARLRFQFRWLEVLVQDFRFGSRILIKHPGAVVSSISALASFSRQVIPWAVVFE